jgi:hypothetical protein
MGFTVLTVVVAVGSAAAFAGTVGWDVGPPARFWLLAVFVLAGEVLPIPVPRRAGLDKVTISTAFALAILLDVGVLPACAVYAAASVIAELAPGRCLSDELIATERHVAGVSPGSDEISSKN